MSAKRRKNNRREEAHFHQVLSCCEEFHLTMMMHFPGVEPNDVASLSCGCCTDLLVGVCHGRGLQGESVIDCMTNHTDSTVVIRSGALH